MKHYIVNRIRLTTALAGIVLSFASFAHAAHAVDGQQKSEKNRKGTLIITAAAEVNGIALEPGEYEVKKIESRSGPIVRFTKYTYNPYAQEGLSVHQWDVVAEVSVTMQALAEKAGQTRLLSDSNTGKLIGLEIRGNSFQYLFGAA